MFLFALLSSCQNEITNEKLISYIKNDNSKSLIDSYYQKEKLEEEDFKNIVSQYSQHIDENNLAMIEFNEGFTFKSRPREGYMFLDSNNNIVNSITFKYVTYPDSTREINFIDFRNSTGELPSLKFPSKFPIKDILMPKGLPPKIDSLKMIYPKLINGKRFYHASIINKDVLNENNDTLKTIIAFNMGNLKINRNITSILNSLDKKIGLANYVLSEKIEIGQPKTYIVYDSNIQSKEEIENIRAALELVLNEKIYLKSVKTYKSSFGSANPSIYIGFAFSDAKVRIG